MIPETAKFLNSTIKNTMKTKSSIDLPVYTCNFIKASDLFKDCELAFTAFSDSSPDCSWGDNDKTMVVARLIQQSLEMMKGYSDKQCDDEIEIVMERLDSIPGSMLVDLEN